MITSHLIERNYGQEMHRAWSFKDQLSGAGGIVSRTASLAGLATGCAWVICQGNFNSDNCAAEASPRLRPFGFCELFEPDFRPWTGGGGSIFILQTKNRGSRSQLSDVLGLHSDCLAFDATPKPLARAGQITMASLKR